MTQRWHESFLEALLLAVVVAGIALAAAFACLWMLLMRVGPALIVAGAVIWTVTEVYGQ